MTLCVACCVQGIDRRERLRKLALETIDLNKDPYFMRNHLGQYECRLCLTLHTNEGNYLAHTQVRPFAALCSMPRVCVENCNNDRLGLTAPCFTLCTV